MKYVLVALVGGLAGVAMVAGLNRTSFGKQILGGL
jgi:hypothetical protein